MRILWVKMGGLWPSTTGGRVRSLQIVSALSQRHQVTLVTTHGRWRRPRGSCAAPLRLRPRGVPPLRGAQARTPEFPRRLCRSWLSSYPVDLGSGRSRRSARTFRPSWQRSASISFVSDFLFASMNVPIGRLCARGPVRAQRRVSDLEAARRARTQAVELARCSRSSGASCGREEADACRPRRSDDRRLRRRSAPPRTWRPACAAVSIPTGVDTEYFSPMARPKCPARLVFSGSMDWHPNEDAVTYFLDAILPQNPREHSRRLVRDRRPQSHAAAARGGRARSAMSSPGRSTTCARIWKAQSTSCRCAPAVAHVEDFRGAGDGEAGGLHDRRRRGPCADARTHFMSADDPEAFARRGGCAACETEARAQLGQAGRPLVEDALLLAARRPRVRRAL